MQQTVDLILHRHGESFSGSLEGEKAKVGMLQKGNFCNPRRKAKDDSIKWEILLTSYASKVHAKTHRT